MSRLWFVRPWVCLLGFFRFCLLGLSFGSVPVVLPWWPQCVLDCWFLGPACGFGRGRFLFALRRAPLGPLSYFF